MTTFDRRRPEETGTETADMSTGTTSGYVNPYAGQMEDLYQSITERQPFQYDVNADVMYQNLRDQYISGGQMAMMDTMGQAAQMTGGYGNSYAQGVGQQAYQGYLQGLNDQIPNLYDMALQNYIQQGDAMLQQYGMLQDIAADDYGKWLDQRNYDYQVSRDEADDAFRNQQFEYQQEQDQADRDYQAQRDATNDAFRNQEFEYQQEQDQADRDYQAQRDATNDAFRNQQFEYQQAQDQADRDYQAQRDAANDAFRNEQFEHQQANDQWAQDYQVSQDQEDRDYRNQQDARELAFAMLEAGTMPSAEMLAAAGLSQEVVGALYPDLMPSAGGTAGASGNGNFPNVATGSDWFANNKSGDGWLTTAEGNNWLLYSEQGQNWAKNNPYDASLADLDYAKNAGVITQKEYDDLKTQLDTQYGK